MEVFEQLKQLIKSKDKQRIVFPEGDDVRILTAVSQLKKMTCWSQLCSARKTRFWLWPRKMTLT